MNVFIIFIHEKRESKLEKDRRQKSNSNMREMIRKKEMFVLCLWEYIEKSEFLMIYEFVEGVRNFLVYILPKN